MFLIVFIWIFFHSIVKSYLDASATYAGKRMRCHREEDYEEKRLS